MFVEMSLAKKTVVDVEEWTARNTVRNMYPGHAIDLKSRHMCAITVQRKSFAQKTNMFIVQALIFLHVYYYPCNTATPLMSPVCYVQVGQLL